MAEQGDQDLSLAQINTKVTSSRSKLINLPPQAPAALWQATSDRHCYLIQLQEQRKSEVTSLTKLILKTFNKQQEIDHLRQRVQDLQEENNQLQEQQHQ